VAERVQAFCFYSGGFENSVESFAEVDGSGDFAVLIRDERTVLAEVEFFAKVFDHFDSGIVERDVALAAGALEFADSQKRLAVGVAVRCEPQRRSQKRRCFLLFAAQF